jgi:hypothetical protein
VQHQVTQTLEESLGWAKCRTERQKSDSGQLGRTDEQLAGFDPKEQQLGF